MNASKKTPVPTSSNPPVRKVSRTAPVDGSKASVNRFLAAYIMGVANRLANGASNYYLKHFNHGMSELRAIMAIGATAESIVREVAEMADLDYAAASKSVRVLEQRGFVSVEQTTGRGRAAIVRLTPEGAVIYKKLRVSARRRQTKLIDVVDAEEVDVLWSLLRRVEQQVSHMNSD